MFDFFFGFFPLLFLLMLLAILLNPVMWLLLIFLFPVIFFVALYFVSLEVLVFALLHLLVVPRQLWYMFRNPIIRKNHALEHATVNVLEERYGPMKDVGGVADTEGFYIFYSNLGLTPQEVLSAAQEGLARLRAGEAELAVHERCGTSITIANLMLSLILITVLFLGNMLSFWSIIGAFVVAYLASKPLGKLAQRYITTDADVSDVEIVGVKVLPFVKYLGVPVPVFSTKLFIETRFIPRAHRVF